MIIKESIIIFFVKIHEKKTSTFAIFRENFMKTKESLLVIFRENMMHNKIKT